MSDPGYSVLVALVGTALVTGTIAAAIEAVARAYEWWWDRVESRRASRRPDERHEL